MFKYIEEVQYGDLPARANEALITRFDGERLGFFRLRDQRKEPRAKLGTVLKSATGLVEYVNERGKRRVAAGLITIAPDRHVRIGELLLKPLDQLRAGQVFFVHQLPH